MRDPLRRLPRLLQCLLISLIVPASLGLAALGGPLGSLGCAGVKTVAKTANDIAREACNVFASAREQQLGMSAADWCNLRSNLEPFLDAVLSAERKAGISAGGERPALDESKDDSPPAPPSTPAESIPSSNAAPAAPGALGPSGAPGATKPGT